MPELGDVIIHRKNVKSEDAVYRVVLDVPVGEDLIPLEAWKSVLTTPELRKEWDPAVESATLLEMLDPTTRVSKTNFTLGWPAKYVPRVLAICTTHILAVHEILSPYLASSTMPQPS